LLSPFLLRAGLVVMSDMQGVFFLLLALNAFISLHTNNNRKYFLLFIIGVAGAVMTRYAMSLLLAPMLAYTGYLLLKQGTKATGHVLLALLLTGILLAPQLMMWFMKERGSFHVSWLTEWSPLNFMQTTFVNSNGNYHYTAQNILYAFLSFFHPGFCFCALFAVFFRKQIDLNNPVIKLSGLSLLLYGILLAGIPFQNLRFIIPAFPFFLLILFPVFEALEPKMKKYGILVFSALILFQLTLFVRAFLPFYKDNKEEKEIAEQCALFPNGHLYTFSITGAIEFYGASFSVIEMGNQKIDHLPNNSYLLFNKTAFEKEYEGKAPMLNYQFIATHYQLTEVKHWTGGWTLYAIR
ncbi:MAG TPA: hypothetical protein VNZ86_17470, partial [Bacteroidia bacterium]|nr:hypothetical protein [Bacteroidia bacterium]